MIELVVMYHHVGPIEGVEIHGALPVSEFEKHIKQLKKKYKIVPLRSALNKEFQPKTCAITFDDGTSNHWTAYKILKENECTGCFFPIGKCIQDGNDVLDVHQSQVVADNCAAPILSQIDEQDIKRVQSDANEKYDYEENPDIRIVKYLLNFDKGTLAHLKTKQLVNEAFTANFKRLRGRFYLSSEEIIKMAKDGMEFGSHTWNHDKPLNEMSYEEQSWELRSSQKLLAQLIKKPVDLVCYPWGAHNDNTKRVLHELGYKVGATIQDCINYPDTNPLFLNRKDAKHLMKFLQQQ